MQVLFGAKKNSQRSQLSSKSIPRPSSQSLTNDLTCYYFRPEEWAKKGILTNDDFSSRLRKDFGQKTHYVVYHQDDLILVKLYKDPVLYEQYKEFFDKAFDVSNRVQALEFKTYLKNNLLTRFKKEKIDLQRSFKSIYSPGFENIGKIMAQYQDAILTGWEMPFTISKKAIVSTERISGTAMRKVIDYTGALITEDSILKLILHNTPYIPFRHW